MTAYTLALFVHIVGALALGAANAVLLAGLVEMRRASTVEQVRLGIRLARWVRRLIPLAALLLLAPAIYLVASAWGWATPWIDVALGAVLVPPLLERAVIEPRLAALDAGLPQAPGDPIPAGLRRRQTDPLLWGAIGVSTALFLGLVFLMTVKPDLGGALVTVGVAIIAGAVLATLSPRRPAQVLLTRRDDLTLLNPARVGTRERARHE